jgi:hypothetical protein
MVEAILVDPEAVAIPFTQESDLQLDSDRFVPLIVRQELADREAEARAILGDRAVMSKPAILDSIANTTPAGYLGFYSLDILERVAEENRLWGRDWRLVSIHSTTLVELMEQTDIVQLEGSDYQSLAMAGLFHLLGPTYGGHHLIDFSGRACDGSGFIRSLITSAECRGAHPAAMAQASALSPFTPAGPLQMFWFHSVIALIGEERQLGISCDSGRARVRWIKRDDYQPRRHEMVRWCPAIMPDQSF